MGIKKRMAEDSGDSNSPAKKCPRPSYEHRIYVSRLNPISSVQSLREVFSQCGKVVDVHLPTKTVSSSNRGFAFVAFADKESMNNAMDLKKVMIDSAMAKISELKEKPENEETVTKPKVPSLRICNLTVATTSDILKKYFAKFGTIQSLVRPKIKGKKQINDVGFVKFDDFSSMENALKAEHTVNNTKLVVTIMKDEVPNTSTDKKQSVNCLHVANVPGSMTKDALSKYFSKYGSIATLSRPFNKILHQHCTFAFVSYKECESMKAALKDKHTINGSEVSVNYRPDDNRLSSLGGGAVCVSGCSSEHTPTAAIKQHFLNFGAIKSFKWPVDEHTKEQKTFVYVAYKTAAGVKAALAEKVHKINDCEVFVCGKQIGEKETLKPIVGGLYIRKIPPAITGKQVNEYFSKFGQVESFVMPLDTKTKKHRSHAFLGYKDAASVQRVLTQPQHMIQGAKLVVEKIKEKKP